MPRPKQRTLAVGAALALLALVAVTVFIPYLTRERETVTNVAVPRPFTVAENIALAPRDEVCLDEVAIDPESDLAEFAVAATRKAGPPLRVSGTGRGYHDVARVAAGYEAPHTVRVALAPPDRSVLAEFCVANLGRRKVELLAAHEPRTASRPVARVNGEEVPPDMALRFVSADSGSLVERIGSLIDRMAAFRPAVLETPVLWMLLVLLVVVVPAAAIYALASSFGRDH